MSSQTRILDYGSTVTAKAINTINQKKSASGILLPKTNIIEVLGNSTLKINPFTVISPNGVIVEIHGTSLQQMQLTSSPRSYTFVLRHNYVNSSGGTAAQIEVLDTFFPENFFDNATVLGWLSYPGGSVALDSTMVFSPRALRTLEPSNPNAIAFSEVAPFDRKWIELSTDSGINISSGFSNGHAYTKILNTNSIIIQNMVRVIPVVCGEYPPSEIRVAMKADFQSGLTLSILDENNTEYFPTNNIVSNTDWDIFYMKLPNMNGLGVFKPHTTYKIKLTFQLNPNKVIQFESVSVSDYNLPIAPSSEIVDFRYPFSFTRLATVVSIWNPVNGLPISPELGDRYISSYTANGWIKNEIREWNGTTWLSESPASGSTVLVVSENSNYVFNGTMWVKSIPTHKINV